MELPRDEYGNFDPVYAKAKYDLQKTIGEIKAKKPQVMKGGKLVDENHSLEKIVPIWQEKQKDYLIKKNYYTS